MTTCGKNDKDCDCKQHKKTAGIEEECEDCTCGTNGKSKPSGSNGSNGSHKIGGNGKGTLTATDMIAAIREDGRHDSADYLEEIRQTRLEAERLLEMFRESASPSSSAAAVGE